jgi:copper chaperone
MQGRLRLSIEGMHCRGCVNRVTAALQGVKGVELSSVEVGSAQMTFQPEQTSAEEIAAAVDRIGFLRGLKSNRSHHGLFRKDRERRCRR